MMTVYDRLVTVIPIEIEIDPWFILIQQLVNIPTTASLTKLHNFVTTAISYRSRTV